MVIMHPVVPDQGVVGVARLESPGVIVILGDVMQIVPLEDVVMVVGIAPNTV
jgi:hypothetical protein